jgi:hypothetical protein
VGAVITWEDYVTVEAFNSTSSFCLIFGLNTSNGRKCLNTIQVSFLDLCSRLLLDIEIPPHFLGFSLAFNASLRSGCFESYTLLWGAKYDQRSDMRTQRVICIWPLFKRLAAPASLQTRPMFAHHILSKRWLRLT